MTIDETTTKLEEQINKMDMFLSIVNKSNETITPAAVREFLKIVLEVVKNTKNEFDNLSTEKMKELKEVFDYIAKEHADILEGVKTDNKDSRKTIDDLIHKARVAIDEAQQEQKDLIKESKTLLDEIRLDRVADKATILEEVKGLIPSPYQLEATKIRDELLSLKGDDRLDISAIKGFEEWAANLPKGKGKGKNSENNPLYIQGGSGYVRSITAGTGVTITQDANKNYTISASGGAGNGDVVGPASSTDNAIARFDSTTGKLIQDSGVTISDTNVITTAGLIDSSLTASEILGTNGSKQLVSLAVATYPSLAELAYVKGVTSAIQTQINAKFTTASAGALTKTDDTNVTLTLGGTPTTALLAATSITVGWTGTLSVARGGTGVGSVTTSPTASAFAGWDANVNLSSNSFIASRTSTATAGGTTTLTVTSTQIQIFTGSSSQTCVLPVATTLANGQTFRIINNSSAGTIAVQSSGANLLLTLAIGAEGTFTMINTAGGTGTASWDWKTTGFTNYTGTGGIVVMSVSPSFTTPALGTPSSGTLTNCTGLPISGIASLGTGVGTALAVNVGSAGAFVTFNGALGTPSSGTLTNCTGLPIAGLVASTSTAIGVGSIELGHATDTTITRSAAGAIQVEGVQVILSGAALGTPSSGTLTNCTGLPIAGLTASTSTALGVGSVELGHATDTTIARVSAGVISVEGVTIPSISSTNTLTNKRITKRVYTATNNASLTPEIDTYDVFHLTAMSAATTINNHSTSTPTDGELVTIRFLDNGTARALTWGSAYVAKGGVALPTTTTLSKNLTVLFEYNSNLAKWNLLASALEA